MLHDWIRFVLESSVQFAFAILPAAPLLGLQRVSANRKKPQIF
jgi:hypothetical protein